MKITHTDALIAVDVQNDFCHGGALPVEMGERVVPLINRLALKFEHQAYSRDWHPHDHCSFSEEPRLEDKSWPPHCIEDTPGAEFHGELHVASDAFIVNKGMDRDKEAYSAFEDTALSEWLRSRGIKRVFVTGLATDYCVRATALDAKAAGFEVVVVEDACRGVAQDSTEAALRDFQAAGIDIVQTDDLE
jgi:nicotinamidase/pyrazinamidase